MSFSRRAVLASGAAGLAFAGYARSAAAQTAPGLVADSYRNEVRGYGPLVSDPDRLLDLPEGFEYRIVSQLGETMDDGFLTPGKPDGMGCFPGEGSQVILVRNHELTLNHPHLGPTGVSHHLADRLDASRVFDTFADGNALNGGTTTVVYDLAERRTVSQHLSLTGTLTNCAGGVTPWGTWLTCEESAKKAGEGCNRDHGWVFEVPASATGLVQPVPLTAMGRFEHEAACVDTRTGYVYMTEDRDDSLLYRFKPNTPGVLSDGGQLQALAIASRSSADLRNWTTAFWRQGDEYLVRWVNLDGVDSPADDLRARGHAAGAALFARGEGIVWAENEMYFTATSGGPSQFGQIIKMSPGVGDDPCRVQLFLESTDDAVYDYGDNLTITPWGHLLVCEDRYSEEINHLRGITPEGQVYTIARNVHSGNGELAGVCISPDGSTVFLSIQDPGYTLAITGPWSQIRSS